MTPLRYVYVNAFKWKDTVSSEMYAGHPRAGKVYRAVYNTNTNNYRIGLPGTPHFFVFPKLILTEEDEAECTCDMVEITKENIVQLNLPEDGLDQMTQWIETDNNDLREVTPEEKNIKNGLQRLQKAVSDQELEEIRLMSQAQQVIQDIYLVDTSLLNVYLDIGRLLYKRSMEEPITHDLRRGSDGRGINIFSATNHINDYMRPVKAGGDYKESIEEAIIDLTIELERRKLNNLDI